MRQSSRDRRHWHPQPLGDLTLAPLAAIEQNQHQPIAGSELRQRQADERCVTGPLSVHRWVGRRGDLSRVIFGTKFEPHAAQPAMTLRQGQAPDPARERRGLAQLIETLPGEQEGILRRILREGGIAQARVGTRTHELLEASDNCLERLVAFGRGR